LWPSCTGGQQQARLFACAARHLWKARKNQYGAWNPSKKLISAPLHARVLGRAGSSARSVA
jgi:hypothetical protein